MAGSFDQPITATSSANSGTPSKDIIKGLPTSLFIGRVDEVITEADIADFETYLDNKTVDTLDQRFFPIQNLIGNEDQTVEAVEATSGYGVSSQEKKALPKYQFQIAAGVGLANNLVKFNNQTVGVLVIDDDAQAWGTKVAAGCKLYTCRLTVVPAGFKDGTNGKYLLFTISAIKGTEWESERSIFTEDFDPNNVNGILDLSLEVSAVASSTITAGIVENISKLDVGATYETEFEDEANWTATKVSDGSNVVITSVTYNATTKQFAFLLADTGEIKLEGQLASAWYADLSEKYEVISTTQTVTA